MHLGPWVHFFCLPEGEGLEWYCFDDDLVYAVSKQEAIDGNFGSGIGHPHGPEAPGAAGGGFAGIGMFPTRGMIQGMKASRSFCLLPRTLLPLSLPLSPPLPLTLSWRH